MTGDDIREFNAYLAACTDAQVIGALAKELKAGRDEFAALAEHEAMHRGMASEVMAFKRQYGVE